MYVPVLTYDARGLPADSFRKCDGPFRAKGQQTQPTLARHLHFSDLRTSPYWVKDAQTQLGLIGESLSHPAGMTKLYKQSARVLTLW